MPQLLLDCEKMKNANTGLFEFCKELGHALVRNKAGDESLSYYIPAHLKGFFGDQEDYITKRSLHKFLMPPSYKPDVWHTTFQASRYIPFSGKTKMVLTIHDLNYLYENMHPRRLKKIMNLVQQNIDRADHIVTISNYVMKDVMQHLHLKGKPYSVIMNGAHLDQFPGFDDPMYRPAKPFLFSLGSVNPKKNFHVLPALLKGNDYELLIAGPIFDEDYKHKIQTTAQAHGVADRVKILGAISYPDKYWYLRHCEAFLFPSLAEGFGIPVIEAMSMGKPCFLSDKTSLPEVGGPLCYYFNDFDPASMQEVFRIGMHYFIQHNTADAIKAHAAKFNYDNTATQYLQVYRSLY